MNAAVKPVDPDDEIAEAAALLQYDPQGWSLFAWDWGKGDLKDMDGPRDWQADINEEIRQHLESENRYTPLQIAVASGHGIGKSAQMGMLSNWAMSCFADCKIVTTANTESQLRTKTSPEIGKWFRSSITAHWFNVQAMSIKARDNEHSDLWRQDFVAWSAHNTEAFAGLHNKDKIIVLMFDEASKIADSVWEVAEGALTDENTIIIWLVFGNPTQNVGRFRECFRRNRKRWIRRNIDSRTVPGTNKKKLDQWVEDYGEDHDFVKVRVRGMFPSSSAKQFIGTDDVDAAQKVHLRPEQYDFAAKIIGVDPAWTGADELVIYFRQGLYSKLLMVMPKNDNDILVANHVARFEDELGADAVFIDLGHGTGIYSAGISLGRTWQLVSFAEKSVDRGCLNKRAEMWKGIRDWLKQGGAIDPKDDVLYQDLIGPELVARTDGKLQLESKEDMKVRGLPSPNRADALGLTFARPVVAKERGDDERYNHSRDTGYSGSNDEYNPYG
ncbi:terminase [Agrobacterium rosae]|uniref:terminase n=1 Tax=Agrobacterium rosae TaxID=1972867 RepID=UPI002A0AB808|nr:terminase [Agrobacterium rosae]MDX8313341.1 terminase [Agrobacterium rosae]